MRIIGIIPARYGSTRFPGKPLASILGRPMIAHVVQNARSCRAIDEVFVATDDDRVAAEARRAGAEAVITPPDLASGTDRVAWVAKDREADVVAGIQGDEPLLPPSYLEALLEPFALDGDLPMTTLAAPFETIDEVTSPRTAKVVVDARGDALYFSRAPIPFEYRPHGPDSPGGLAERSAYLRHIGVYAYRREFLRTFASTPPVEIERRESLEQLRALWLGARVRVVRVARATIGVDTPEDLAEVERFLGGRANMKAAAAAARG